MNRETWERQFTRQLKHQLGLELEQIRFHWKTYFNHLEKTPEDLLDAITSKNILS
jgi:hypothetical protein